MPVQPGNFNKSIFFEWDKERYQKAPVAFDRIVRAELGALVKYLVEWMKQRGPKDTGVALESLEGYVNKFAEGAYELIIESRAPYAKWALQTGRNPGKKPPLDQILGWVNRRGFTAEQRTSVERVGKTIGTSYRLRKSPKTPLKRIDVATREYSVTTTEKVRAAYLIMKKIALHGTNEQLLFTRAISQTNLQQSLAISAIERQLFRAVNEGAF
jgi:hypothetical protein